MKDLDRSKVYDLSDLNVEQRTDVRDWLVKNDIYFKIVERIDFIYPANDILFYKDKSWNWKFKEPYLKNNEINKNDIINALELFEEEPIFKDNPHLSVSWPNIEVKYETSGN